RFPLGGGAPGAALGPEVVLAVLPGTTAILVGVAPRIFGNGLLEVGAVPVGNVRVPLERVDTLARVRVAADIEPVLVECRAKELDLRPRGGLLRLAHAAEEARPDETHQEPE